MDLPENKELVRIILDRIQSRGKIPFIEFMNLALYHPQEGYYFSPREKTGPEGDYYTSPHVHPIFGHLLARQLHQMWEILGHPSPFVTVEMGAGKGLLGTHILNYCRRRFPHFYRDLLYRLAEINPPLEDKQKTLVTSHGAEGKVEWISPAFLLERMSPFTGCVLSNELIDAFPVHLVQQKEGKLQEIYIFQREEAFQEILGPLSNPFIEEYLRHYGAPLGEGQRAEVNLRALEWVEGVSRVLNRGFILTIDYGYEAAELYHPDRRDGTLLCYFQHTLSSNPYQRIGYQDMTSHVNFTALMKRGESLGLRTVGYTEQYKFLVGLGLLQDLEEFERASSSDSDPAYLKNKLAMRNFLVPGGMGTLFKVLAQRKGMEEAKLLGFQDPFCCP
jgi:SAM-dependent MidA family methyltransferase